MEHPAVHGVQTPDTPGFHPWYPPLPMQRPNEHELLELIEGGLSPAREREVRALVSQHTDLARQVQQMSQQRSMLKELASHTTERAPDHMADSVVAQARAEHLADLSQRSATAMSIRPRRTPEQVRRVRTMAAAAGIGLLVMGGWVAFLLRQVGPNGVEFDEPIRVSKTLSPVPESTAPNVVADVKVPIPDASERIAAAVEGRELLPAEFVGPLAEGQRIELASPMASLGGDTKLLDEWLSKLDAEEAGVPEDRAAELALAGRLAVVVELQKSDAGTVAASRSQIVAFASGRGGELVMAYAGEPKAPAAQPLLSSRNSPAAPLSVALEHSGDRDALAAQLKRLATDLALAAGGTVRYVERADADAPSTSVTASDLLWWNRPAKRWAPTTCLRLPVELRAGATGR